MKLETYRWQESQGEQRCEHDDCFTCPYPDCIASERRIRELLSKDKEADDEQTGV